MRTPSRALALALFALFAIAPIAAATTHALAYSAGLAGLLSDGFTLEAWSRALGAPETWASILLSIAVAAAVATLATALGLALALAFGTALTRAPLSIALYAPLAFPGTVAALVTFQWFTESGLLARLLVAAGCIARVEDVIPLVNDPWAAGIVITHVAIAAPFLALTFERHRAHERVDELLRVAATLGASRRARILRVAAPVILRRGASSIALVFVVTLGSYEIPLLLGQSDPQMLSVLVLRKFSRFDLGDKPEALAIALLYAALVALVLAVVFGRSESDAR